MQKRLTTSIRLLERVYKYRSVKVAQLGWKYCRGDHRLESLEMQLKGNIISQKKISIKRYNINI